MKSRAAMSGALGGIFIDVHPEDVERELRDLASARGVSYFECYTSLRCMRPPVDAVSLSGFLKMAVDGAVAARVPEPLLPEDLDPGVSKNLDAEPSPTSSAPNLMCKRCKRTGCVNQSLRQTQRADEGMAAIYDCEKCGAKWH
jgi:DNA-directed RNA polymerase subunit M/transcription elongation factor TFIIS